MKYSMRRIVYGLSAGAIMVVIMLAGGVRLSAREESVYKSLDVMCDVIGIIQRDYIERISSEKLIHDSLRGMLASLDSYSHFIPAPEPGATPCPEGATPELGTYGVEVACKDKLLTVIAPIEYGPAWKSGLKSGDIIIKIGEDSTEEHPLFDLVHQFRSGASRELKLQVARRGERDFLDFVLKPGKIAGPAVREAMLEEKIGAVRVSRFDVHTTPQLTDCLKKLSEAGADGLVIDLRDCPGGDMGAAIAAAGLFLKEGAAVATLEGRALPSAKEFKAKGGALFSRGPLVLMVNHGTSGAAEVFAGALQGSANGILMGQTTFGCAFEEGTFPLSDGAMIKMITGIYMTPDGVEIQDEGLDIDVEVPLPEIKDEEEEMAAEEESRKRTPLPKGKKEEPADPMLQRAVDLIKGIRIVERKGVA